jgi:hypothetical protein
LPLKNPSPAFLNDLKTEPQTASGRNNSKKTLAAWAKNMAADETYILIGFNINNRKANNLIPHDQTAQRAQF